MIRLMGSIFVFAAGGCVWYLRRRERQERGRILSDLTAALAEMETAIRLERTSLPMLLTRLAEGREPKNAALFLAAARSLRRERLPDSVETGGGGPAAAGGGQASAFPSGRGVDRR